MKLFARKSIEISGDAVLILYGTKTGNSRLLALEAEKYFKQNGLDAQQVSMGKCTPAVLKEARQVLFIVSTHDDGEPPVAARKFYKQLLSAEQENLPHLAYSICALGDTTYETYCEAGRTLEKHLQRLQAACFNERVECDVDFAAPASEWIKTCYQKISKQQTGKAFQESQVKEVLSSAIFNGTISKRLELSTNSEGNLCYHIEVKLNDEAFAFAPGDSIEIIPQNPAPLVELICHHLEDNSIKNTLKFDKEICRLTRATLAKYYTLTAHKQLHKLLQDSEMEREYLRKANVFDLLNDFPSRINAQELLTVLPPLRARQYSIANSAKQTCDHIELTIKTIRFQYNNTLHEGCASVFTNETLNPGDKLYFRHVSNPDLQLPLNSEKPVILIGNGTGIAPLRAMLQELAQEEMQHKIWLLWGEEKHVPEHMYVQEIKALQDAHKLERVDFVESRSGQKVRYVQDLLKEEQSSVADWIAHEAHIYVCGSKDMEKGVRQSIDSLLKEHFSPNALNCQLLQEGGRYFTDVY